MLTGVAASGPSADPYYDDTVGALRFTYNDAGRLTSALSVDVDGQQVNKVSWTYDAFGNLTSENLKPQWGFNYGQKTTHYYWCTQGQHKNRNRLEKIIYPSGREVVFDYGGVVCPTSTTSEGPDSLINRVTGLTLGDGDTEPSNNAPLLAYGFTGGGRVKSKVRGNGAVNVDYTFGGDSFSGLLAGTDRFGRVTNLTHADSNGQLIHRYQYGYDSNGNRLFAWIEQNGQVNERSYAYGYDVLNRLTAAERGQITDLSTGAITSNDGVAWALDALGNWRGGAEFGSHIFYTPGDGEVGFDPLAGDTWQSGREHVTDPLNRLMNVELVSTVPAEYSLRALTYDPAGNTTSNIERDTSGNVVAEHHYAWDAWDRLARVEEGAARDVKATYEYDALGRRIQKRVFSPAELATEGAGELFYYAGHRIVEHHKANTWTETVCEDPEPDPEPDPIANKLRAEGKLEVQSSKFEGGEGGALSEPRPSGSGHGGRHEGTLDILDIASPSQGHQGQAPARRHEGKGADPYRDGKGAGPDPNRDRYGAADPSPDREGAGRPSYQGGPQGVASSTSSKSGAVVKPVADKATIQNAEFKSQKSAVGNRQFLRRLSTSRTPRSSSGSTTDRSARPRRTKSSTSSASSSTARSTSMSRFSSTTPAARPSTSSKTPTTTSPA